MQEADTIQVLGRGTSVDFTIDDSVPFEIAERSLREYLEVCRGLYSSGTVSVNVGRRILAPDQLSAIKKILDSETGLTVSRYWCAPETLQSALYGRSAGGTRLPHPLQEAPPFPPESETAAAVAETERTPSQEAAEGQQLSFDFMGAHAPALGHVVLQQAPDFLSREPQSLDVVEFEPGYSGMAAQTISSEEGPSGEGHGAAGDNLLDDAADETDLDNSLEHGLDGTPAESLEIPGEVLPTIGPVGVFTEKVDQEWAVPADTPTGWEIQHTPGWEAGDASRDTDEVHEEPPREPRRGNEALIIKNTCRSGEVIRYPGDVVVFGDVNPGAVIIADGDIIVLGALRGMAQAGAGDDPKATILALNLESKRLQIGQHAGEAPRDSKRHRHGNRSPGPQIAYLRRGSVFVAPFARRREEYQGGILYEG